MQGETKLRSEQKIYRWQNGALDRPGVQPPQIGLIPGGIYDPFVIGDGTVYGWQVSPSHGLARLVDFPNGEFHISANGRYVTGSRGTALSPLPAQVLDI